jgi:ABC-2 type transport system ATP-binding protein
MGQRLGIAGALLGDPRILMFDEPVNGLDPEGILWIRNLMKGLAAEGRTVFVSSHLMSEMQHTADHLLVIGRGRMIADCTVREFIDRSSVLSARVRTSDAGELARLLRNAGGETHLEADGTLVVTELPLRRIGDIAFDHGLRVHELASRQPSLEEAFMDLTRDAVEYQPAGAAR